MLSKPIITLQKNTIYLSIIVVLVLSLAGFQYHQSTQWQYQTDNFIQQVDLSLYSHRGVATTTKEPTLETKIAKIDQLFAQQKSLEALAHYQQLLEEDPNNTELLLRIGVIYLQEKQYEIASEHLQLVYADKDAAFALDGAWFLGLLQCKYGNKKNAQKLFEEVVNGRGNYYKNAQNLLESMA